MNRGNITPAPEFAPVVFGFPQYTQAGLSGVVVETTPWALMLLVAVPQSPIVAP